MIQPLESSHGKRVRLEELLARRRQPRAASALEGDELAREVLPTYAQHPPSCTVGDLTLDHGRRERTGFGDGLKQGKQPRIE